MNPAAQWRSRVACAAETLLLECSAALEAVRGRAPLEDALARAAKDGAELLPIAQLEAFEPTESFKATWMADVNKTASELGRLLAAMQTTDDPLADKVSRVAVCVAKLLGVIAEATTAETVV